MYSLSVARRLGVSLVFGGVWAASAAASEGAWNAPPPISHHLLMGVMGDSITAATEADLPIPLAAKASASLSVAPSAESLVRMWGDQRFNTDIIFENKNTYSWASGQRIDSHYMKLKSWLSVTGEPRPLDVLNVAYPGDTTFALQGQAAQIVDKMGSGGYDSLEYVTMLIGANDACSTETATGTPLDEIEKNIMGALGQLATIRQADRIRVMLVGIPQIPSLGADTYRGADTIFHLTCQTVRNIILRECNPLLLWTTPQEYTTKQQVVSDLNQRLQQIKEEANARYPNLEVVYSNRLYEFQIPIELLAIDCFHPNMYGQEALSEQIWQDQPWFN